MYSIPDLDTLPDLTMPAATIDSTFSTAVLQLCPQTPQVSTPSGSPTLKATDMPLNRPMRSLSFKEDHRPITPPGPGSDVFYPRRSMRRRSSSIHRRPSTRRPKSVLGPPSPINNTQSLYGLESFAKLANSQVQCMVCHHDLAAVDAAKLVCSHYSHIACLHDLFQKQSKLAPTVLPGCLVCNYPCKPQEADVYRRLVEEIERECPSYCNTASPTELSREPSTSSSAGSLDDTCETVENTPDLGSCVPPVIELPENDPHDDPRDDPRDSGRFPGKFMDSSENVGGFHTPPQSIYRAGSTRMSRHVVDLLSNQLANRLSVSSSIYDAPQNELESEFEDHTASIGLKMETHVQSLDLKVARKDRKASMYCAITISPPQDAFHRSLYVPTEKDAAHSASVVSYLHALAFAQGLDLRLSSKGLLRLQSDMQSSLDGTEWRSVTAYLFSGALVLCTQMTTGAHAVHLTVDVREDLEGVTLQRCNTGAMCAKLTLQSGSLPLLFLRSNKVEDIHTWVAALNNSALSFPLTPSASRLQSAFNQDFVERVPLKMVLCLPEYLPIAIVAELLGRLGSFDELGFVFYGHTVTTVSLHRQSWEGWRAIFSGENPTSSSASVRDLVPLLTAAGQLLDDSHYQNSVSSVILVCDSASELKEVPTSLTEAGVTINTIGVGNDHDAFMLSKLSASMNGGYVYCETSAEVSDCILNMALLERSYTHTNINLMIRPSEGCSLGSIDGYRNTPSDVLYNGRKNLEFQGLGISSAAYTNALDCVIPLGSLRAGQTKTLLVRIDADLKDARSVSLLKLADVSLTGTGLTSGQTVYRETVLETGIEWVDKPVAKQAMVQPFGPLGGVLSPNSDPSCVQQCIEVRTIHTLETCLLLLAQNKRENIRASINTTISNLEDVEKALPQGTPYELGSKLAHAVARTRILVAAVMCTLRLLRDEAGAIDSTLSLPGYILSTIWLLRSKLAFSRRSNLAAVYFDDQEVNVL